MLKSAVRIGLITIASLLGLLLLVYILLWLNPVQQKIKDIALAEIMQKTHNQIHIKELHFRPFNRLRLEDVFIEDLKGDTLLFAGNVEASFDLFRLLNERLLIRSVDLDDFIIRINKDNPQADFNFRFFIDAFQSEKQDATASAMIIQINDIALKNGCLSYDVLSEPAAGKGLFDANHIYISGFQADIDLNSIDLEKPDIALKKLSFIEQSGLNIKQLQATLTSGDKQINLKNFRLQLPHSELNIPDACLDYSRHESVESWNTSRYTLHWGDNAIFPDDLKMFYPPLGNLDDELNFTGSLEGTLPTINLSQLTINYGEDIRLNIRASLADYRKWENTPLQLNLEELSAGASGIRKILDFTSGAEKTEEPLNTGAISLSGNLTGRLPDMQLLLVAGTERGTIQLNASGAYNYPAQTATFDAQMSATDFDLQTLLQDTLYNTVAFQLNAQGGVDSSGKPNVAGTAAVSRFDFNRYAYHDIRATVAYTHDSLRLKIDCEDANIPLAIRGHACFDKPLPEIRLYARLDSVYLDSLHLLADYKDAFLSTRIRLNTNGLDAENMNLSLSVDSFALFTDKGSFTERQFRINYLAADSSRKQLDLSSNLLKVAASGNFTFAGIKESLAEAFPVLFPNTPLSLKKKELTGNCRFYAAVNHTHLLSDILDLPEAIPDSALFIGKFNHDGRQMQLAASAYTQFSQSDTLQMSLMLSNRDKKLELTFNVDNKSNNYDFDGSINANVEFVRQPESPVPGMNITLNPEIWVLNGTHFELHPAQIEVRNNRYAIRNLLLEHQAKESIKIQGFISDLPDDSLAVNVSNFRLGTIFSAVKTQIPLSGEVTGEIVAKRLLSKPVILSRGFAFNQLIFAGNTLGDLNIRSAWSSERKGLFLRAILNRENHLASTVSGYFLPEKDSLSLTATIRDLELQWLKSYTQDVLFGLDGNLNLDANISGKPQKPQIKGVAYFDRAKIGVAQLNTLYSLSDSIYISEDLIELKRFTIKDPGNQTFRLNGKITHRLFADLNPNLSVSLSNFLVINNERQTDSLFYGKLRVNGLLNVKKRNNTWVLSGDLTHSNDSKIMVNIPSPAMTAERYNSVTFVQPEPSPAKKAPKQETPQQEAPQLVLPLKINISFWLDPTLTLGAVFNPNTRDAAQVKGNGSVNFTYDMSDASIDLKGNYEIESGKATLSLANLTRKTFSVKQGGKLTFLGNPLATTFDLTALYALRADLKALDPSFEEMDMAATKIPVTCALTATGSINQMELKYNLLFANEQDEIQRKVEGLLYTDDLKIKEIAYLLAFGTFMPVGNDAQSPNNSIWTSLASSSITGQLNNLLSSVLSENWSIGTDLRTKDSGFSEMNMDVNISTRLFDDRLTVNSTLGYRNDPSQTDNFTGDFDLEYKLTSSGNVLLKAYNVTNNQYYRKAKSTQGAGIVYKRGARTFGQLFDKLRKKKKQEDENK